MEEFIVSARKYRPATFADVVGQPSVTTTLKNSIRNKQLGHAYLFSGPRGVGKTTCARIFARTINCLNLTQEGEACHRCESCASFDENRSFNIHELDAASNNSVDDIRNLTEQVRVPPQVGRYSIYIIDEVHMLSQAAFNAFLKTLEEPPGHAVFILATTEKQRIIPTILSRCQIFDFNRIRVEDTVNYLRSIAEKEGVGYEDDALHIIAQKGDGAMRDALSIFDQVVSFSGDKITYREVIENLNILDYEYYFRLTRQGIEGDLPAMLLLFHEVLMKGFDERNFLNSYAEHLRDLMVCKDPQTVQLLEVGAGIREKYLSQSAEVPLPFLYRALEICHQADSGIRSSRNQRLTIELALMQISQLTGEQKKKVAEAEEPSADASPEPESPEAASSPEPESPEAASPPEPESPEAASDKPGKPEPPQSAKPPRQEQRIIRKSTISIRESLKGSSEAGTGTEPAAAEASPGAPGEVLDPGKALELWKAYADTVRNSHPRMYSTLMNHPPQAAEDGTLRVELNSQAQYDYFQKDIRHGLTQFMREKGGGAPPGLVLSLTEQADNGKKIYTDQDKLDFLVRKNPELAGLKNRLGLDFDE